MSVTIYFEGGGRGDALRSEARRGLNLFLTAAGFAGRMPRIVACGSRQDALARFEQACQSVAETNNIPILLVDSEVEVKSTPTLHLASHDAWQLPVLARESQVHLMVQCMESWFLADPRALRDHFGNRFDNTKLPVVANIETLSKKQVFSSIQAALRNTHKQRYSKADDSFRILARLEPERVTAASKHARDFLEVLDTTL